jgi:hypothetical protein
VQAVPPTDAFVSFFTNGGDVSCRVDHVFYVIDGPGRNDTITIRLSVIDGTEFIQLIPQGIKMTPS